MPQDRTVAGIHPEWSPTSELIAFTIEELTSDGQYRISVAYLFDLRRPEPRRMFPVTEVYARDLSWFPDGKWLVVMARTSPRGESIWRHQRVNASGVCSRTSSRVRMWMFRLRVTVWS